MIRLKFRPDHQRRLQLHNLRLDASQRKTRAIVVVPLLQASACTSNLRWRPSQGSEKERSLRLKRGKPRRRSSHVRIGVA